MRRPGFGASTCERRTQLASVLTAHVGPLPPLRQTGQRSASERRTPLGHATVGCKARASTSACAMPWSAPCSSARKPRRLRQAHPVAVQRGAASHEPSEQRACAVARANGRQASHPTASRRTLGFLGASTLLVLASGSTAPCHAANDALLRRLQQKQNEDAGAVIAGPSAARAGRILVCIFAAAVTLTQRETWLT